MNFFQEFRTETKLLLIVALVAIFLAVGGILLLVSLGRPITPGEPGFSTAQETDELKTIEDIVGIDVSVVDTTNWRSFAPYAKITIKTPRDWYPKTYPEEPNAVTYGSGIASFLTIRHFDDPTIEEQRTSRFINEGRSVTKEVVYVGIKEFTRHTIGVKCVSDVCDFGFRDWYVVFGNDVFIFSENAMNEQEKATIAAVIGSVAKFSDTLGDNNIDTSNWSVYNDSEYGYTIELPSDFKEVKRERTEVFQRIRFISGTEVIEFDIRTTWLHKGEASEVEELRMLLAEWRALNPQQTVSMEEELMITKVKNVNLNGCLAPQVYIESDSSIGFYTTGCVGESYGISFELHATDVEDLEYYRKLLDASLSSFKF